MPAASQAMSMGTPMDKASTSSVLAAAVRLGNPRYFMM